MLLTIGFNISQPIRPAYSPTVLLPSFDPSEDPNKADLQLRMLGMTADDLILALGRIARQEDAVMDVLRSLNQEAPFLQHDVGKGIGQLYGEYNVKNRYTVRRDFARIAARWMIRIEAKALLLEKQTDALLADVQLLVGNMETARGVANGVIRTAKRDIKRTVAQAA
jgi:hypothetical protein